MHSIKWQKRRQMTTGAIPGNSWRVGVAGWQPAPPQGWALRVDNPYPYQQLWPLPCWADLLSHPTPGDIHSFTCDYVHDLL